MSSAVLRAEVVAIRIATVKKALIVALVVLVIITGLPILVGGVPVNAGACHDCGSATMTVMTCVSAVMSGIGMNIVMLVVLLVAARCVTESLDTKNRLFRP